MNSRNFLPLIMILVFILYMVTGCLGKQSQHPQGSASGNGTAQGLDPGATSEPEVQMGSYPSPGRKATIIMKGQFNITDGSLNAGFYLAARGKQDLIHQSNLGWDWANPVVWVDDKRVLLHNTWLYDLSSRKGRDLSPTGAEYVWASAINLHGTLLAMTGKTSSSPVQIAVWILNLENGVVNEVTSYPPNSGWTDGPGFHLSWDIDNNLYFDADYKGLPAVFRYSITKEAPELFLKNAWAPAVSPDAQHLAYFSEKGYYYDESFHTKIREIKSGKEIDTGLGGGYGDKYWSPDGSYLAQFQDKTISFYRVAKYQGEKYSLERQYTMSHSGFLRFIEFVDYYSYMLVQESTESNGFIKEARFFVLGPDVQKEKVWKAAREYMEYKGNTVGPRVGDMGLAVGDIFDHRAVVIYGPMYSEFFGELLLEEESGTWRVVTDQPIYDHYLSDEIAVEAIKALALQEILDLGREPGKVRVHIKEQQGLARFTLIVGKNGWPWSKEYDIEKVNGVWEIMDKRELQ